MLIDARTVLFWHLNVHIKLRAVLRYVGMWVHALLCNMQLCMHRHVAQHHLGTQHMQPHTAQALALQAEVWDADQCSVAGDAGLGSSPLEARLQ